MPIFQAPMVAVLISLFSLAHSHSCHEGFNVSLSGIPFYYWAEHQCERNSECFMQEITRSIPNTKLKGKVLRFGGCVSISLASRITCQQLYAENSTDTIENMFDMLRGLDDKLFTVYKDMIVDGQTHFERFFSRGKGSDEFIDGVLEFLKSLCYEYYDKEKIEAPFNNFVRDVALAFLRTVNFAFDAGVVEVDDAVELIMSAGGKLLRAAQVNNQATQMLSRALLHFVSQFTDDAPTLVGFVYASDGPGVLYPILRSNIAPDELQGGYDAVAKGFINLDVEQPQATVAKDYQAIFLKTVVVMQSFISVASPKSSDKAHQTTKKIIQVYKEANLDWSFPEEMMKLADSLDKSAKEMTSFRSRRRCGTRDFSCLVNHASVYLRFWAKLLELIRKSNDTDPNEELVEALSDYIVQNWKKQQGKRPGFSPRMFADFFDLLQPEVEKLAHKLRHEKNQYRKLLFPETCKHLRCSESRCNSHEAFSSQKNTDNWSEGLLKKEEL